MTRPTLAADNTLEVTTRGAAVADDPVLSPQEVSMMLGGIPVATLKRWRTERTGPAAMHIGRHVRYRRSAVEAWLAARDRDAAAWMST
jgi:excisionase family DNA binding protein